MKARIIKHNYIDLSPENDADAALLGAWSEMKAVVASLCYSIDRSQTTSLVIGFKEKENKKTENHPKDAEE